MKASEIDKAVLKELIKEVLREDISLFKTALKEIIDENKKKSESSEEQDRLSKIKALIQEDFDEFKDVYEALA